MDPVLLWTIVMAMAAVIGLVVAYVQWRENHADRDDSKLDQRMKDLISLESKKTEDRFHDHALRLTQVGDSLGRIEASVKDVAAQQRKTADEMIEVRTRLTMTGTALEQLAMNAAKNIHQPDPRRAHIDELLESFMEGTLTPSERIELRKILINIRNWEPKSADPEAAVAVFGFPIYPGEQTSATILLSTMDVVDPNAMASLGHSAHRSASHNRNKEGGHA